MQPKTRWVGATVVLLLISSGFVPAQTEVQSVFRSVSPSLVTITAYDAEGKVTQRGTGFFIEAGDIILARHVIYGAKQANVRLANGKEYSITTVVGDDPKLDLVRVQAEIPEPAPPAVTMAKQLPNPGEQVFVFGYQAAENWLIWGGSVTDIREIPCFGKVLRNAIELTTWWNASPMFNLKGEAVGVISFLYQSKQPVTPALPWNHLTGLLGPQHKPEQLAQWNAGAEPSWWKSTGGLFAQGLAFLIGDNYNVSAPLFEKVTTKDPTDGAAWFLQAYSFQMLAAHWQAREASERAARLLPKDADVHFLLGVSLAGLDRFPEAVEELNRAIQLRPDFVEAYYNLGIGLARMKQLGEAVEAYRKAIRFNPNRPEIFINLGISLSFLKRFDEALASFREATRLQPKNPEAHFNMANTMNELGQWEQAIDEYKNAIQLKPEFAAAYYNLGLCFLNLGQDSQAIDSFRQAIKIDPEDANAHLNLGVMYAKLQRFDEAQGSFATALKLSPNLTQARSNLIRLYLLQGQRDKAMAEYEVLKKMDPSLSEKVAPLFKDKPPSPPAKTDEKEKGRSGQPGK